MGYGVAITFFAIGAVLVFALRVGNIGVLDLHTVGWILMGVGGISALLTFIYLRPARRARATEMRGRDPIYTSETEVIEPQADDFRRR